MKFRCQRCSKMVSNPAWLMWEGRLVRVGQCCAKRIRDAKGGTGTGQAVGDSEQPRRGPTKLRRSTWLMLFRMLTPPTTPNPALLRR
jgi:hypothetical protein